MKLFPLLAVVFLWGCAAAEPAPELEQEAAAREALKQSAIERCRKLGMWDESGRDMICVQMLMEEQTKPAREDE